MVHAGLVATTGRVREWHDDEGWGVIDSAATPGGCWTHYSHLAMPGFRRLQAGQAVELEWETPGQDGCQYRALRVWSKGEAPADRARLQRDSAGYRSALIVSRDGDPS